MTTALRVLYAVCLVALLPACERSYIEGRVTDVRGEALPGVVVRTLDTSSQDLTDGLGRYRLAAPPGAVRVGYSKTGYGSIEHTVNASTRANVDVALWLLPLNPGVYVVENFQFIDMIWMVPKQYFLSDGTAAFGAVLPKELHDTASEPFIVAYRTTSRYNARLSRLMPAEAKSSGDTAPVTVWIEAGTMDAALEPLDAPTGPLFRLQVGRALEPGVYGVHWGAMSGYTTLDTRVFLFRVPEETAVEPPAEIESPAAAPDAKPADSKKTTAPPPGPAPAKEPKKKTPPASEPIEPAEENAPPPAP